MKTYGQFCPLAQAAQLLCERWTLIIIREFIAGSSRFSELQKGVPLMSPTLLSTRLKQLVAAGVLIQKGERKNYRYELTQAGKELKPLVELLGAWGQKWAPSNLQVDDLDAGLLMWDMRRSIKADIFPNEHIVVQFIYPDAPKGTQNWWLVSSNGEIDLCLNDHNYEVNLVIECSLKTMTSVWTCQHSFNEMVKKGKIKVLGDTKLASKLQAWLQTSPLSKLGSLDKLPKLIWEVE